MYEEIREDNLFIMFFAVVAAMAMIASCYLLFRRGNAFAADIKTPARLRRWTAVFFAFLSLNHLWYMPIFFLTSCDDIQTNDLIGGLLDCLTVFPLAIVVLFTMLQDRRRPLWLVAAMISPIVILMVLYIVTHSAVLQLLLYAYFLLMCIGLIAYMVRALRQYGSWLRDNYADLEHKEVWQSFVMLAIILLTFGIYAFTGEGPSYQYAMQVMCVVLICYLLWRVETLIDLAPPPASSPEEREQPLPAKEETATAYNATFHDSLGALLQQYCIDTQLYLQHDLTVFQLAKAIGTNRLYLGQYFSRQGITYNAYINDLRINHFVGLYREAVASRQSFTAQQLAHQSGYQSYSTFSLAFKQRMGMTVTAWMREAGK